LVGIIRLCGLTLFSHLLRRSGREPCRTTEFPNFLTLSRVVARQLGLLAQVRCPARGSARVTSMKHNVRRNRLTEGLGSTDFTLAACPCRAEYRENLLLSIRLPTRHLQK
jgi:hypothetical protein